ncbi:hypothetical protein VNI00_011218 [Paramarasmius palmivorus]|uniref:Uncharacterized protein n=1 Tax=Paramarasmius palmivorus TaxID=297713 RepID=A0AAW0CEB8_9AGAR
MDIRWTLEIQNSQQWQPVARDDELERLFLTRNQCNMIYSPLFYEKYKDNPLHVQQQYGEKKIRRSQGLAKICSRQRAVNHLHKISLLRVAKEFLTAAKEWADDRGMDGEIQQFADQSKGYHSSNPIIHQNPLVAVKPESSSLANPFKASTATVNQAQQSESEAVDVVISHLGQWRTEKRALEEEHENLREENDMLREETLQWMQDLNDATERERKLEERLRESEKKRLKLKIMMKATCGR